ncbi:hypothetical protein [Nocardia terpenica]|uniref:hypothetical protein n=1 Tax=Nocardia terpenica TaxID=455432 RepID=UPI002FE227C4
MTEIRNRQSGNNSREPLDDFLNALMEVLLHAVWYLLVAGAVAVWWAVLFPLISIPVAGVVVVWVLVGWQAGVAVAGVSVAGIMLMRAKRREMFERLVTRRARARFLTWWRYKRSWTRLLDACHLTVRDGNAVACPLLCSVVIGDSADRVVVKMLAGQCPADYENRVDSLSHTFGALDCRATITGPGVVELLFRRRDALADPIVPPARHLALPRHSKAADKGEAA